jgi:3-phytase
MRSSLLFLLLSSLSVQAQTVKVVSPTAETDPVPSLGDAADDPAIWHHPTDLSKSRIIGTDKQSGLYVYDLAGKQVQALPDGPMNNVDIRHGVPLNGSTVALVAASDINRSAIALYAVDANGTLSKVSARVINTGITVYGITLYRSHLTGKHYVFINEKGGTVQQWELREVAGGKVDASQVRWEKRPRASGSTAPSRAPPPR